MIRSTSALVLLVCGGLMLAACGKKDDGGSAAAASGSAAASAAAPASASAAPSAAPSASAAPADSGSAAPADSGSAAPADSGAPTAPGVPGAQRGIEDCCAALAGLAAGGRGKRAKNRAFKALEVCPGIAAQVRAGRATRAQALTQVRSGLEGHAAPAACR
jgi:hypothetical protein